MRPAALVSAAAPDGTCAFILDGNWVHLRSLPSGTRTASRQFKRRVLAACFGVLEGAGEILLVSVASGSGAEADGGSLLFALDYRGNLDIARPAVPLETAATALAYLPPSLARSGSSFAAGTAGGGLYAVDLSGEAATVSRWRIPSPAGDRDPRGAFVSCVSPLERVGALAVGFSGGAVELYGLPAGSLVETLPAGAGGGVTHVVHLAIPDDPGRGGVFVVCGSTAPQRRQLGLDDEEEEEEEGGLSIASYYVEYESARPGAPQPRLLKVTFQGPLDLPEGPPAARAAAAVVLSEPEGPPEEEDGAGARPRRRLPSRALLGVDGGPGDEGPARLWLLDYERHSKRRGALFPYEVDEVDAASETPLALWADAAQVSAEGGADGGVSLAAVLLTTRGAYASAFDSAPRRALRELAGGDVWAALAEPNLEATLKQCREAGLVEEDEGAAPDAAGRLRRLLDLLVDRGLASAVARYALESREGAFRLANPRAAFEWAAAAASAASAAAPAAVEAVLAARGPPERAAAARRAAALAARSRSLAGVLEALAARGDYRPEDHTHIAAALERAALAALPPDFAAWLSSAGLLAGALYDAAALREAYARLRAQRRAPLCVDALVAGLEAGPRAALLGSPEGEWPPRSLAAVCGFLGAPPHEPQRSAKLQLAYRFLLDWTEPPAGAAGEAGRPPALFAAAWGLAPPLQRLSEGLWLLDRREAPAAAAAALAAAGPAVPAAAAWMAARALAEAGGGRAAGDVLAAVGGPPRTADEAALHCALLAASGLLPVAFALQRRAAALRPAARERCVGALAAWAAREGRLQELLRLPWDAAEDAALVGALQGLPHGADLVVAHHLQRGRLEEAAAAHAAAAAVEGEPRTERDALAASARAAAAANAAACAPPAAAAAAAAAASAPAPAAPMDVGPAPSPAGPAALAGPAGPPPGPPAAHPFASRIPPGAFGLYSVRA